MQVWVCIVASTLAMGPVVGVVSWAMRQYPGDTDPSYPLHVLSFNMFRSVVMQGNLLPATRWPDRFILFFWFLFCFYISGETLWVSLFILCFFSLSITIFSPTLLEIFFSHV